MKLLRFFFLFFGSFLILTAQETSEVRTSETWLYCGPFYADFYYDAASGQIKNDISEQLKFDEISPKDLLPANGNELSLFTGQKSGWKVVKSTDAGFVELNNREMAGKAGFYYLASYLESNAFFKGSLEMESNHLFRVWLNGEEISSKPFSDKEEPGNKTAEIKLENGKHLLLIKLMPDPQNEKPLNFKTVMKASDNFSLQSARFSLDPAGRMNLDLLLFTPAIRAVSVSPDGELAAVTYQHTKREGSESWVELIETGSGKVQQSFKGEMNFGSPNWAPAGKRFIFQENGKEKTNLWLYDVATRSSRKVLADVKDYAGFRWAKDGSFIIYYISQKAESDKIGLKKIEGMQDRWPTWRNYYDYYLLNIENLSVRKLISGKNTVGLHDIHPNGKQVLLSEGIPDFTHRPYTKDFLYTLDLQTLKTDTIFTGYWLNSAQWSPDGKKMLFKGGPSLFGEKGWKVAEGQIPNESDQQLYLFDLKSGDVEYITKNFDPSVISAVWSHDQKYLYLNVTERSTKPLYRYELHGKAFKRLECGVEVVDNLFYADQSAFAVFTGESATDPAKAYFIDLKRNKTKLLANPAGKEFANTKFGDVERWTFINQRGTEIEGRIYYPPGFDKTRKYPLIVYYYGGVSPVERDFGGRYPKNYYAANGYIVYVLQPSGAVGFGQEFSAYHTNDWGKVVADEIIDGVQKFLTAHENIVDREKVGCIGASYGGFMTMLLQTRTDIFTAAVSHAGISSISGYWGEGFWGFWYNSISAAGSFPWNRKDIYIEQSALYSADKINTPLLLLHGDSDTNVPPGESRQLYTALKLLGKEVELIEVAGQDHWILEPKKREKWTKTIIAWFDRWLKDDPSWWNDLYPEK